MNIVQVFGLPRSGTNLLEYIIIHYFNIKYENLYQICEIKYKNYFKKEIALKHCKPFIKDNKIIIIYRELYLENISSNNYYHNINNKKQVHEDYLKSIDSFKNNKKCLIIKYEELVKNPKEIINSIEKFLLKKSNCYSLPKFRLDKSGGKNLTKEYFKK